MEVTGRLWMPQGTMSEKASRSVATLSAKPWWRSRRERATPIAATFASPTQTPHKPPPHAGLRC